MALTWLTPSGTISTYLSIFDAHDVKIPKDEAKTLFDLSGKMPMSLVTARETRSLLLHHCNGSIWRVDPKLKEAVEQALKDYYACRAPIVPLGPIQSLAFIGEQDMIECKLDLEFSCNDAKDNAELSALIEESEELGYSPKVEKSHLDRSPGTHS